MKINGLRALNDPKNIMCKAVKKTKAKGSSTCCIAALSPRDNIVNIANLGDSGFVLLRKSNNNLTVLMNSVEQWHKFNHPYQVSNPKCRLVQMVTILYLHIDIHMRLGIMIFWY